MLEAIMAFFPIKEDHDAIGSIDYPMQVRSKLAINSQKWSCDICGLISGGLPERKPKPSPAVEKLATEGETNIIKDDGDNISDVSSVGKIRAEASPDNKTIKKGKHKKVDFDRKSHLSHPIEAVIIEDINEDDDEDFDMESRDNTSLEKKDTVVKTNTIISELVENIPAQDMPNRESSADQLDFMEYLRKLRSTQFDSRDVSPNNIESREKQQELAMDKMNKEEEEEEITLKTPMTDNRRPLQNDQFQLQQTPVMENMDNVETILQTKPQNMFKSIVEEEAEFYRILKTIKYHNSVTIEDINKEIFSDKIQDFLNSEQSKILKEMSGNIDTEQFKLNPNDKDEQNKAVIKALEIFNQKDKLENMLKQKNNALKYYVRRRYKETKQYRLRTINIIMAIVIVIIFGIYYLVTSGWTKTISALFT